MTKQPKRLGKEPLVEALFELRFESNVLVATVLPGIIFAELAGNKSIEKLPASGIPAQIRDTDPHLRFAPEVRINWESFFILISNRSIVIGCTLPYPGWTKFKEAILKVIGILTSANFASTVNRIGMKYVDLIESTNSEEQVRFANLAITVGGHKLKDEIFQVRMEIPRDGFTHAIQMVNMATLTIKDKGPRSGLIVDIDSTKDFSDMPLLEFSNNLDDTLQKVHDSNIAIFYSCLTEETIRGLEPIYE